MAASKTDKEFFTVDKNPMPLLDDYPGIYALKLDIMLGQPKNSTFTCLAYPICEFIRWKSLDETIRTFDLRSPEEQIVLFWTGIWQLNYFACAPIATFILMLDRCLILWTTARNFNKYFETLSKWMGLCCLILCYLISLIIYLNELPLNRSN